VGPEGGRGASVAERVPEARKPWLAAGISERPLETGDGGGGCTHEEQRGSTATAAHDAMSAVAPDAATAAAEASGGSWGPAAEASGGSWGPATTGAVEEGHPEASSLTVPDSTSVPAPQTQPQPPQTQPQPPQTQPQPPQTQPQPPQTQPQPPQTQPQSPQTQPQSPQTQSHGGHGPPQMRPRYREG
jgi:hypothetical protein